MLVVWLVMMSMEATAGPLVTLPGVKSPAVPSGTYWREGEALVRLRPGTDVGQAKAALGGDGVRWRGEGFDLLTYRSGRTHALVQAPGFTTDQLLARLREDPRVEHAQPNWVRSIVALPDDPLFPRLWGLHNTGQVIHGFTGLEDADIDAPEAWDVTTGSPDVVVASLDTGIDYTHRDLADRMWVNPGEQGGVAGEDDDGNGWIDDLHGIAATWHLGTDPLDDNGHGTHTAATMVGSRDAQGLVGVAPGAKVMALKFLDEHGSGSDADAVRCILYAIRMKTGYGVNVVAINASWGGIMGEDGDVLSEAIAAAGEAGIAFVAAAGNEGADNDPQSWTRSYPASYAVPTIVTVAATDALDRPAVWTNRGRRTVDLAAPGAGILSAVPGGGTNREIFFDDLESGDAGWEHGGDADYWALTGEDAFSGGHAWTDSPEGPPPSGTRAWLNVDHDLDLTPWRGRDVRLSFQTRTDLPGIYDFQVAISRDGGSTWILLALIDPNGDWRTESLAIPEDFKTDRFRFRFIRRNGGSKYRGAWLDDIALGVPGGNSDGLAIMSGTSMAAPHVTGALALTASRFPDDDVLTRVRRIISGVDPVPALSGMTATGGRLNAANTLRDDAVPDPLLTGLLPEAGVRPGETLTLEGAGFGPETGRVLFEHTAARNWDRSPGFRVRFRFLGQGSEADAWEGERIFIDDVRITRGDRVLFADDMEHGQGDWVHGGRQDAWALTGQDAHASALSWTATPLEIVRRGADAWLALDREIVPGDAGTGEVALEFWARTRVYFVDSLLVEISTDGGERWHALDSLTGSDNGWTRYRFFLPAEGAEAEILSWDDGRIVARVPTGAGRFVRVIRSDGRGSNLLEAAAWMGEPEPVKARTYAAAAADGRRIWFTGGQIHGPTGPIEVTETVEVFRPGLGWKSAPPMRWRRYAHAAAVLDGRVYVMGGEGMPSDPGPDDYFGSLDTVEMLDPAAGRWVSRAPLPAGMFSHAAATLGGKVWVSGGVPDGFRVPHFRHLLAYDPRRDAWEEKAPMGEIRAFHALVTLGGKLYALGGQRAEDFMNGIYTVLASGERYDPATDAWEPIADMPAPRWGMAAATDGRHIYLVGGASKMGMYNNDGQETATLFVYDPVKDAWTDASGTLDQPLRGRMMAGLAWLPGRGLHHLGGMNMVLSFAGEPLFEIASPNMERLAQAIGSKVALLEPAGGEAVASGSTLTIRWDAPATAVTFSLDWSDDGGVTWRKLARRVRGHSRPWTVPAPAGSLERCRIRVTAYGRTGRRVGVDISGRFAIRPLTIPEPEVRFRLVTPNEARQYVLLAWETHATRAAVSSIGLAYSLDDGATWTAIGELAGDPGFHEWLDTPDIPFPGIHTCRLRVVLRDAAGASLGSGISPAFFLDRQGI
jgi:subtilisin family serine protease/N-acetylneuraminic acid mutarotase